MIYQQLNRKLHLLYLFYTGNGLKVRIYVPRSVSICAQKHVPIAKLRTVTAQSKIPSQSSPIVFIAKQCAAALHYFCAKLSTAASWKAMQC